MTDCERFEATIRDHIAGDLDPAELEPLLAHCRTCEGCRQLVELHRDLVGLASRMPEPSDEELDRLQARVLRASAPPRSSRHALRTFTLAAGFVLALLCGLLAGRVLPRANGAASSNRLIGTLSAEAASNRALADVEDSRFTYSNVSFRRVDGDRIALAFDVTTHLEVVEPERSALVREVLVQSLLNPASTGARLKAMSLAAGAADPKIEDAIAFSLRRDPSQAVRLAALAILSTRLEDDAAQAAVLEALRDDESVQIRLLALESLAAHRVDHVRLRDAIQERERPGDEALMVRLAEYEKGL